MPKPLPLPGQLKPLLAHALEPEPAIRPPARRTGQCRGARPADRNGYINAVQVYPFVEGALYQVYAAPGR